ncbi:MAG: hypothetical protein N4R23_01420 [Lactobacillus iners]|uniref:hypothetical protein n=1 Tax=Lactobacillus iners TaxID=147802 RepID=UPI0001E5D739|nr:hypothetical protein [Lactobacillus iners]EFO66412.1 hypothetical protein HMPREF9214_1371 [Lactobacillus iners LactinV 11V1-d]EFQ50259.1 hypothetical protein HMPREF9218_0810 [Lactobacillus iners LEAF 2062A-h1]MCT7672093.1 hypothetical protein [Lactobacillus iners]MCT7683322.1 hypothetical protein [Lactobacillus iners]MCT7791555.1 hypothetical protein [Lactobacillus iners]
MKNRIPLVLLNDVEDQISQHFSANELIDLTYQFAPSFNKHIPIEVPDYALFNNKKELLSKNLDALSDEQKVDFLSQIKYHSRLSEDDFLRDEIDLLVKDASDGVIKARNSVSTLLETYSIDLKNQWQRTYRFYDHLDYRNALDNMRLTIELLIKRITGSEASLENQKSALGKFFEDKDISKEVRNLFFKMLDMYEKIQNHEAKHNLPQNLNSKEIKFLMNQSTVIIKFLIDCDKGIS